LKLIINAAKSHIIYIIVCTVHRFLL